MQLPCLIPFDYIYINKYSIIYIYTYRHTRTHTQNRTNIYIYIYRSLSSLPSLSLSLALPLSLSISISLSVYLSIYLSLSARFCIVFRRASAKLWTNSESMWAPEGPHTRPRMDEFHLYGSVWYRGSHGWVRLEGSWVITTDYIW